MPTFVPDADAQYIKLSHVKKTHDLSANTVLRLHETDPTFPRLVVLSPKCKLLNVTELNAWLKAQEGQPRGRAIRAEFADSRGEVYRTGAKEAA